MCRAPQKAPRAFSPTTPRAPPPNQSVVMTWRIIVVSPPSVFSTLQLYVYDKFNNKKKAKPGILRSVQLTMYKYRFGGVAAGKSFFFLFFSLLFFSFPSSEEKRKKEKEKKKTSPPPRLDRMYCTLYCIVCYGRLDN